MGISESLVKYSVGLAAVDDLIADLRQALDSISNKPQSYNLIKSAKVKFQKSDNISTRASGSTLSHLLLLTLKKGWSFGATPSLFPINNRYCYLSPGKRK
jgi:hypothetical protein